MFSDELKEAIPDNASAPSGRWRYCAVGNIVKTHMDENGVPLYGTSAFPGGTRVYLCGKYWDRTRADISVIGLSRGKRYQVIEVPLCLIENIRFQRTYKPSVLSLMDDWEFSDLWWDNSQEDLSSVKRFISYVKEERTVRTRLETNNRIYKCLCALRKGYTKGDFEEFFEYMAEDCVFESQWVMTPNVGAEAVKDYLTGKGETLKKTNSFPHCYLVELVGDLNPIKEAKIHHNGEISIGSIGLLYTPGKLCLMMEQTLGEKTSKVLVDIRINESGLVKRVDLCMPELFNYRYFDSVECVDMMPAKDTSEEGEHNDGAIRISSSYFDELYLFLGLAGVEFDEYAYPQHIPMEQWVTAIGKWEKFASAYSFDAVFEELCGVDYDHATVGNEDALRRLSRSGEKMWNERQINRPMLNGLVEWTQKYRHDFPFVTCYGY